MGVSTKDLASSKAGVPGAPPAPAPSSHQLMYLAAPADRLRPSCWQPRPGRYSQPIAFFILLFTHMLAHTAPMASSALNHSWPALSKLWLKRWAFKRGKGAGSEQWVPATQAGLPGQPAQPSHPKSFLGPGAQSLPEPAPNFMISGSLGPQQNITDLWGPSCLRGNVSPGSARILSWEVNL